MRKLSCCIVFFCIILGGCALWKARLPLRSQGDITFSHRVHLEIDAECEMCHTQAAESELASDNNYPKEQDCIECHEREECSLCHLDVDNAIHIVPKPTKLIFSHKAHLVRENAESADIFMTKDGTEHKVDCLTCHSPVKENTKVAEEYPAKVRTCRMCHQITEENCALCHYTLGEVHFIPISHNDSWLDRHQEVASAGGEKPCGNCHRGEIRPSDSAMLSVPKGHVREEDTCTCAACHRGDIWPEEIHGNNYLQLHGVDALADQDVCNSCHQRDECLLCHERRGISFFAIHTQGWQFNHADEARRRLSSCSACHGEEDCLGCHQTISPHPSAWDEETTEQNEEVCSKCHI